MTTVKIVNATVFDGSGAPPFVGDVTVSDGRIVNVTRGKDTSTETADQVIDASGLSLMPGLIDAHSHNDYFYDYSRAEDYYRPFIEQGITTQVTGNCGFSVFGVDPATPHMDEVRKNLFTSKQPAGYEAFRAAAEGNLYVNMAPLIGHGMVRSGIAGKADRELTEAELDRMCAAVDEAMSAGAFGGSLGLMYEPGMYAPKAELVRFAECLKKHDGILTVHPRACSKIAMDYPLLSKPHIELALDEVVEIMKASGVRAEYSHMIFVGRKSHRCIDAMLRTIKDCRREGHEIAYDIYSMTFGASIITVVCPPWYLALSPEKRKSRFNRLRLKLMIDISRALLGIDYEDMQISYLTDKPEDRALEGRTVAEIAAETGQKPFDVYLDLVERSDGQGQIFLHQYLTEDLIERLMRDEDSVFMTDAWYTPKGRQNTAAFQCFPNFFRIAAERGIAPEAVIHKMTGKTAERFRIPERGFIREGYRADLTLADPSLLTVDLDEPTYRSPLIRSVMINGQWAMLDGIFNPRIRAGKVLVKAPSENNL